MAYTLGSTGSTPLRAKIASMLVWRLAGTMRIPYTIQSSETP